MRESFVFYASFYEAIKNLEPLEKAKAYDAIAHYSLTGEILEDTDGIAKIIFTMAKPQIEANQKRFVASKKGGRPKKEKTNGFENKKPMVLKNEENKKPNVNVNVNDNVNVKVNDNVSFLNKKENDPFVNSTKKIFSDEYEKVFNAKPFLSNQDCIKLSELKSEHEDFVELIPIALSRLKAIEFKDINFTPTASWLLKGNNFERVMNDEFKVKTESDWLEKALEKCNEYT